MCLYNHWQLALYYPVLRNSDDQNYTKMVHFICFKIWGPPDHQQLLLYYVEIMRLIPVNSML